MGFSEGVSGSQFQIKLNVNSIMVAVGVQMRL